MSGILTTGVGGLGVWLGLLGMFGSARSLRIGWLLPLSGVWLDLDPLGGFFITATGAVAIPIGVYLIGYRHHLGRVPLAVLPLFVAAMLLVPAAGSVTTFLLAWELMAIASLVLVLAEHTRAEVRSAGRFYAVMTQLGFVAVLIGLMVLSAAGGADRFADLTRVSDAPRTAVFVLTVAGFGSKAGLVPLHAWLPRAHPEAPSPVSALMSAAMVNLGIYGIVRFDLQLLGPGPRWWGLTLLVDRRPCPRSTGCCRPRSRPISNGCLPIRPPRTWDWSSSRWARRRCSPAPGWPHRRRSRWPRRCCT